eukprot:358875-Chlamydomonas_euryale.AAC.4
MLQRFPAANLSSLKSPTRPKTSQKPSARSRPPPTLSTHRCCSALSSLTCPTSTSTWPRTGCTSARRATARGARARPCLTTCCVACSRSARPSPHTW